MNKHNGKNLRKMIAGALAIFMVAGALPLGIFEPQVAKASEATDVSKVIAVAEAEVGYIEKASNKDLNDKTKNAGNKNWTKYAAYFDKTDFYNAKKNPNPWCDMFVDWCFVQAYGIDTARKLLCQPRKSGGAMCSVSLSYYKKKGQFYSSNPRVGDQIFFADSSKGGVYHTGLVYKVDSEKVYIIEGNAGTSTDRVKKNSYSLSYKRIKGYGRPAYSNIDVEDKSSAGTSSVAPFGNPNEPVVLIQTDYKNIDYGYNEDHVKATVSGGGCALLSITNAVYYLTGNRVPVATLAQYALDHSFRSKVQKGSWAGTKPGIFRSFLNNSGTLYGAKFVTSKGNNYNGTLKSDAYQTLREHLNNGEVATCHIKGHYMAIVAYRSKDSTYLILDSYPSGKRGTNKKSTYGYSWRTEAQLKSMKLDAMWFIKRTNKTDVRITPQNATNITNNSAKLGVEISPAAYVKTVGIFYGEDKDAIKKITLSTKHQNSDAYSYKQLWAGDAKSMSSYYFDTKKQTTQKGHTIRFEPGKWYRYRMLVQLSDGTWLITSKFISFQTKKEKPEKVKNLTVNPASYAINEKADISWKASSQAESYRATLFDPDGKEIWHQDNNEKKLSCRTKKLTSAGTYTIKVVAKNAAGTSDTASKEFTVVKDPMVTFDYNDGISKVLKMNISYGGSVRTPKTPYREGYTFEGWQSGNRLLAADAKIDKITTNATWKAKWKLNQYTVQIVDGITNQVIVSKKMPYGSEIDVKDFVDSNNAEIKAHKDYSFAGYSEETHYVSTEKKQNIYALYSWNSNYNMGAEIKSVKWSTSTKTVDGYSVDVRVYVPALNKSEESQAVKGRVVVAMKTDAGRLMLETESSAFVLYPQETQVEKTINVFVPYETDKLSNELPTRLEAYVVNNYYSGGIISDIAEDTTELANQNAGRLKVNYSSNPVNVGDVIDTEKNIKVETLEPDKNLYQKTETSLKWTTDEKLSGYEMYGDCGYNYKAASGKVDGYVESWPKLGKDLGCGFDHTGNVGKSLYDKYNKSYQKGVDESQNKLYTITVSKNVIGYIYYHWCRGEDTGHLTHVVNKIRKNTATRQYKVFEAFYSTKNLKTEKRDNVTYYCAKDDSDLINKSKDSYYWFRIPVYSQQWTEYRKVFKHRKITETKVESAVKPEDTEEKIPTVFKSSFKLASTGQTKEYEYKDTVKTVYSEKPVAYAYRAGESIINQDKNCITSKDNGGYELTGNLAIDQTTSVITGSIDRTWESEKDAVVYVYKDQQISDYTTEAMLATTIQSDGSFRIGALQTREEPSSNTGDFTVAVAVEGETNAAVIGKIMAPKPEYTVTFQASNGSETEELGSCTVTEGDTAQVPASISEKLLNSEQDYRPGFTFTGWDNSLVNIKGDMTVNAEFDTKEYAVVFVDWNTQNIQIEKYKYGEQIYNRNTSAEEAIPEEELEVTANEVEEIPLPEVEDDTAVKWVIIDQDDGTSTQSLDEFNASGGVVTGDMVIAAEYSIKKVELNILHPEMTVEEITQNQEPDRYGETEITATADQLRQGSMADISEETAGEYSQISIEQEYGDFIQLEELEESYVENENVSDIVFLGWKTPGEDQYLKTNEIQEDMTIYPVYCFGESVHQPEADLESGEYEQAQTVSLSCDTDNSVLWYTTDGSNPKTSKTAVKYEAPIAISNTTELNYYATALGKNDSDVNTAYYAVNSNTSGKIWHLVTITSDLSEESEEYAMRILVKDGAMLNDDGFKNVTGYQYRGLYYDEEGKTKFETDVESVTKSLNLCALYNANSYEVKFYDEDGTTQIGDTQQIAFGHAAQLPDAPKKEGSIFIGWTPENSDYITENTSFTANYIPESEYASVSLNRTELSVKEGNSYQLIAEITPEELSGTELRWESSNEDVAVVDENGIVTFYEPGEVIVTATVVSTGESASCSFTVTKNPDVSIVLGRKSKLDIDVQEDASYLRRLKEDSNTVEQIRDEFLSEGLIFRDINGNALEETDFVGTGTTISMIDTETDNLLDEVIVIMTGDIDGNGKIQNKDITMLSQCMNGDRDAQEYQMLAGDGNGDGYVNERDTAMLSRYLVGKETLMA